MDFFFNLQKCTVRKERYDIIKSKLSYKNGLSKGKIERFIITRPFLFNCLPKESRCDFIPKFISNNPYNIKYLTEEEKNEIGL